METYAIEWEYTDNIESFCLVIEAESIKEAIDKHEKIFEYPRAMNEAWKTNFSKEDLDRHTFHFFNTDKYIAQTTVGWEEYKQTEGEYFYLSAVCNEETAKTQEINNGRK